jgi:hypothetical protein
VGPSGNVYVADLDRNGVLEYNPDGQLIKTIAVGSCKGIFVDSSGFLYVADSSNHCIKKYDPDGNNVATYTGIRDAKDVVVAPSGNIYAIGAIDTGSGVVPALYKISPTGSILGTWNISYVGSPRKIAADSSGNIYVAAVTMGNPSDGGLFKYNGSDGSLISQFFAGENILAVDSDASNKIYCISSGTARKVDTNGNILTEWSGMGGGDGIAVTRSGEFVYIGNGGNGNIYKYKFSLPPSNHPPVAMVDDVTVSALTTAFTATAVLDGSQSYDPDQDDSIVEYRWDFGDGSSPVSGTDSIVTHTYNGLGAYTVTLTVKDTKDATGTDTGVVTMNVKAVVPSNTTNTIKIAMANADGTLPPGLDTDAKVVYLTKADMALYHAVSQGKSPKTGKGFEVFQK